LEIGISVRRDTDKRRLRREEFSQPINLEYIFQESDRFKNIEHVGQGIDISSGGLGVSTPFPLSEGQIVRLTIPLQNSDIHLPIFSEVVWATDAKGGCRAGLQFLG
jgi:hypothetical protein